MILKFREEGKEKEVKVYDFALFTTNTDCFHIEPTPDSNFQITKINTENYMNTQMIILPVANNVIKIR
jgi:hypothetical protein